MLNRIERVMYLSKGRRSISQQELLDMCSEFAAKNSKVGVTGVLIRIGNYFVQIIEGPREQILELLGKIKRDPRHSDLTVITQHADNKRVFAQWSMNAIDLDSQYYVNLNSVVELREQVDDMVNLVPDNKQLFVSLIKQIVEQIRGSGPRPTN